jgi:VWFA-related protein
MNCYRRLALGVLAAVMLAAIVGARAQTGQQKPIFRAGVSFVRVDVYPAANGRPVGDLTKDDFEILEDGVPQAVSTFDHVSVRPGAPPSERVEPRSTREANQMAADARNRVFVLFLDTYHVTDPTSWHDGRLRLAGPVTSRRSAEKKPLGPRGIDKAITNFLNRAIGPDDLVAAASPERDVRQLTFTRRPESFEEWVGTIWARRFAWDDLDPEEERWALCYPPDDVGDPFGCYRGILEEMVLRRREGLTLQALRALVDRLAELREGRKAVLVISEGWPMFRPNQRLARPVPRVSTLGCPPAVPQGKGIFVGPGGKPGAGTDPRTIGLGADFQACESSRVQLAALNNELTYRELLDEANRANVTFYPIDPRGLAVLDTPLDAQSPNPMGTKPVSPTVTEDQNQLRERLETLRNLASATDGRMTETNDFAAGMKKIADDLSEYYLLGYYSTNAATDGKFRKITVRVKRPGVEVRARRGYRAPTEAEIKERARAEVSLAPEAVTRDAALASLDAVRSDRPLRLMAGVAPGSTAVGPGSAAVAPRSSAVGPGSSGGVPSAATALGCRDPGHRLLWVIGELDLAAARLPDWAQGQATITVASSAGDTVASDRATVSPTSRGFVVWVPGAALKPGEYLVRVRLQGRQGSLADTSEQVRVVVPDAKASASCLGDLLLFRRGPYTGVAYQPTADVRFRKAERVRVDVPLASAPEAVTSRVLDRKGQPLSLPVTIGQREEGGVRFATAEVALAPLAPADYVIEVSARYGTREEKVIAAIRIIPL